MFDTNPLRIMRATLRTIQYHPHKFTTSDPEKWPFRYKSHRINHSLFYRKQHIFITIEVIRLIRGMSNQAPHRDERGARSEWKHIQTKHTISYIFLRISHSWQFGQGLASELLPCIIVRRNADNNRKFIQKFIFWLICLQWRLESLFPPGVLNFT